MSAVEKLTDSNTDSCKPEGKIVFKLEKFSEFTSEEAGKRQLFSDPVFIRGLSWKIKTFLRMHDEKKYLTVGVQCNGENRGQMWNCNGTITYKILSQKNGKEDYKQPSVLKNINTIHDTKGIPHFLALETILNPENGWYNETDDCIIIEAHIVADVPKGLNISADDVLILNKIELNVNKHNLAIHSDYFKTLYFNQNFHQVEVPTIEDPNVDLKVFKRMLATIYPAEVPLDEDCVESVLFLARRFLVSTVTDKCEEFLLQTSVKSPIFKYRLAVEYNLKNLKKNVLDGLKKEDFAVENFWENHEELNELNTQSKDELFARYHELCPSAKRRKIECRELNHY